MNTKKALALGNALLVCMAVPWALCVIIYSGLHWTYPRDKARAMDLAMEEPFVHPEVNLQRCSTISMGKVLSCNSPILMTNARLLLGSDLGMLRSQLLRAQTLDLGYTLLPRTRSATLRGRLPKRSASCPELLMLHSL